MITVHHLDNSRSLRIVWLLEALQQAYELVTHHRDPQTLLAPESLKRLHPLGKAPLIVDEGLTVAESGAIIDYLIERYDDGRLAPPVGTSEHRDYRYWLHYAEGSAMPPLVMHLVFSRLGKPPVPAVLRPVASKLGQGVQTKFLDPEIERHLAFWESTLTEHAWFAGSDFTAADIQMSFPVLAVESRRGIKDFPAIVDWLARVRERPDYQRAVAQTGELNLSASR
ncbi:glutathione S-transferase [Chromohalobacter salexigens]|uniref:glutathione transferase n=1 Tax=Chromohalobacter moromii TaxID=2860329 RepID=A0A9X2X3F1_9GAMM|nr:MULTISPECIES: glutathione S-transferase [Chromohalobacter]NWO08983.1 glutathione S-transferase [Chromohalobacter salexigens]MCK2043836.1 glutathione S-transferase [Chromohalobacter moromii]MCK2046479.1 glutathione S-transferase [Chromohalobacter moromii]MCT8505985.1 glutathione S-transferase [Chromohalobacter moromii]MCT8516039.1 glutathione S-transferase [Chromohalobacter sp. TMW 2.2271]